MVIKRVKIFPITYFDTPTLKSSIYTPIFAKNNRFKNKAKFLVNANNLLSNEKFNELTAIYDIWKYYSNNLDFVGVCHYRRMLSLNQTSALSHQDIYKLISENNIILPRKRFYWPFNLSFHYIFSKKNYFKVHKFDLEVLKESIIRLYPDYLHSFKKIMKKTSYHGGHIFLMRKNLFDSYCEFTFNIAFELEKKLTKRIDQTRYISALTEFALDIWIDKNKLSYSDIKIYESEKIPFLKKIFIVLKRIFND
jgi:hypothetical protein